MKAKKAVKRLAKVVAMLSRVIKQYAPSDRQVRTVLSAAKASVVRAKAAVNSSASPGTAAKAKVTAKRTTQKRVTAAARKEFSAVAKKQRAVEKSRGVHAERSAAAGQETL
jgi:hypothetical protein